MTGQRKTDLAWAAGMLDGEGSIQVKRQQRQYKDHVLQHWLLHVNITNAHLPTIHRLKEVLGGGSIGLRRGGSGRMLGRIEWSARKAAKVLEALSPYVFTKREQVEEALKFRRLIRYQGAYGRSPRPTEVWAAMEQLANSVNALRMHKVIPSQAADAV